MYHTWRSSCSSIIFILVTPFLIGFIMSSISVSSLSYILYYVYISTRRSSWEIEEDQAENSPSESSIALKSRSGTYLFSPLVRPNWRVVLVVWSLYNVCVVHKRAEGCIHLTEPSSTCLHRTGLHDALRFGCYFLWTVLLFPFPTCRGLEIWSGKCGFASLPLLPSIRWQDNNLQFLSAQVFLNVCVCVSVFVFVFVRVLLMCGQHGQIYLSTCLPVCLAVDR